MVDPSATMTFSTISRELHSVISGLIGGAKYGVKIRLPHALLMTFLFRPNLSASQKLKKVLKLSLEHAVKLAAFASIYKVMISSLKWMSRHLRNSEDSENIWKSFGRVFLSMIGKYETHLSHVSLFCLLCRLTLVNSFICSQWAFSGRYAACTSYGTGISRASASRAAGGNHWWLRRLGPI
jgi:hypothetical protein